jgi:serine/threonine-protein kinase
MTFSKPHSLPAQPDLLADRYRIEQPLGEGGMASIYRVLDTVTGTQLALKQLTLGPTESGSQARTTLFQREYHALKQLAHPRIIKVHDY